MGIHLSSWDLKNLIVHQEEVPEWMSVQVSDNRIFRLKQEQDCKLTLAYDFGLFPLISCWDLELLNSPAR